MTVSRNHASTPTFMPRAPHRSRDGLVVLLIVPYERYSLRYRGDEVVHDANGDRLGGSQGHIDQAEYPLATPEYPDTHRLRAYGIDVPVQWRRRAAAP